MSNTPQDSPALGWPVLLFVTANFVSNVGTWLFVVASSWLMTELDGSALMVSLVQSATTIPMFLFALPAGALGDLYDRRRTLLVTQTFLTLSTAGFAYIVFLDRATVPLLLLFTFLNGVGAAFSRPVMGAIIPQLVSKANLRKAVNLGGISFNLSRSVGPAVGGYLITRFNIALPFWVDAATFLAVLLYLFFWRDEREGVTDSKPPPLTLAIGDSWRFFRHTPALRHSILRAGTFFFGAGALWGLLPLVARERLNGEADLYGFLVGAAGAGAVVAGFFLGRVTRSIGANQVLLLTSAAMSVGLALLGWSTNTALSLGFATLCGAAWQAAYTTLTTSTQYSLPAWFGARGMAYYIIAVSACLAVGSAVWGWLADLTNLETGHYAAAAALLVMAVSGRVFRLDQAKDIDVSASKETLFGDVLSPLQKPTTARSLLVVEYTAPKDHREELLVRLRAQTGSRYRSGALRRRIISDKSLKTVREEILLVAIKDYGRSRLRTTKYDAKQEKRFTEWLAKNDIGRSREVREVNESE